MSKLKYTRSFIYLLSFFILVSCTSRNLKYFYMYYQGNSLKVNCDKLTLKPKQSIVFLSETTHGSENIRELNSCLIKYLVKKRNFRTIVLEYDFSDIELLNYYISGNKKITKTQAIGIFKTSFYNSVAMIDLVEWLKLENARGAGISIYGTDNWNYNRLLGLVLSYSKDTSLKSCIFENQKTLRGIYENCKTFISSYDESGLIFRSEDYYLSLLIMFINQVFSSSNFDNQQNKRDKNMYKIFMDIKKANINSKIVISMHLMHSLPHKNRFGEYLIENKMRFENYLITFCKGKISLFDEFSKSFATFNFDIPNKTTIENKICNSDLKDIEGNETIRNLGINYSKNFINLPNYIPSRVFAIEESDPLKFFIK